MCLKNNPLNCWEAPKPPVPQHKDEMPKCDGYESRKKRMDGARSNPKHRDNGQSAAKLRTGERSTTKCSASDWQGQWWASVRMKI